MIAVPEIAIFAPILIIFVGAVFGASWYRDLNAFAPEWKTFKKARKNDIPVLNVVDVGSLHARYILGEKVEDGAWHFEDETFGITMDPSITSGDTTPTKYPGGLTMYNRCSTGIFPQTERQALAAQNFVEERKRFTNLDVFSDIELSCLVKKSNEELKTDIEPYIERCFDSDDSAEIDQLKIELISEIQTFKEHLQHNPVKTGWFTWQTLFKITPYAYMSQNLKIMKDNFEKLALLEAQRKDDQWIKYTMFAGVIGVVGIIIVAIIYLAK